ncbi:MAG TPA: DUF1080 domain-containing protein [Planctomycetaceae bacterium]|nr:DUF1080 domain-containing protein [Planctomycetaceae bacterium]HRE99439.1 DUF1080 domain-containing protein [Pirellulaceae bacterium]
MIRIRTNLILSALLLGSALLTSSVATAQESIFNGTDLTGWEGDPKLWSVEDGAITGRTTAEAPITQNTFLIWRAGKLENFELRLKFRVVAGNSGIQYRSTDHGDFVVGGYQADIDATNRFMGILYEERGRGILANRGEKVLIKGDGSREVLGKTCDEETLLASLKNEDWNDYVITANGNHLTQSINGHVTVDVTDEGEQAKSDGVLAFQLHVGPAMIVQFKEITLKKLD